LVHQWKKDSSITFVNSFTLLDIQRSIQAKLSYIRLFSMAELFRAFWELTTLNTTLKAVPKFRPFV